MATPKSKLAITLTLVSMVLGFMIAIQYRGSSGLRQLSSTFTYNSDKVKQLNSRLTVLQKVGQNEQKELSQVRAQLTAYEKQAAGNNQNLKNLQARLQQDKILAGTSSVEGPGIALTVTDGNPPAGANAATIDNYIAHDYYIRELINELFASGAEAVDINGVRIVSTSGIFCGGPVIWVNNNTITAPFTVRAIGDPTNLKGALTMPGGEIDILRNNYNLKVSPIKVEQSIKMQAYTGTLTTSPAISGN